MLWWGVSVGNTSKIPFQPDFLWFLETEDKQIFNEVLHVPGQTCFILVHLYMFQILCCDVREQCDICTIPHFSLEQNRARNLLLTHLRLNFVSLFAVHFLVRCFAFRCGRESVSIVNIHHLSGHVEHGSPWLSTDCASDILEEVTATTTHNDLILGIGG